MLNSQLISHESGSTKCGDLEVLSIGAFGSAIAKCLRHQHLDVHDLNVSSPASSLKELSLRGDCATIVAASRPAAAICELVADIAHEKQCSFLPVVIEESVLRVGPVVVPNIGGCWRCWTTRCGQHDSHPRETAALHDFYDQHPDAEPRGYLEPFAWIAASQITTILSSRRDLEHWAGKIWQLDLFSREVTTGELVGVDACSRCGLNRSLENRTFYEMQHSLAYLWNGDAT